MTSTCPAPRGHLAIPLPHETREAWLDHFRGARVRIQSLGSVKRASAIMLSIRVKSKDAGPRAQFDTVFVCFGSIFEKLLDPAHVATPRLLLFESVWNTRAPALLYVVSVSAIRYGTISLLTFQNHCLLLSQHNSVSSQGKYLRKKWEENKQAREISFSHQQLLS